MFDYKWPGWTGADVNIEIERRRWRWFEPVLKRVAEYIRQWMLEIELPSERREKKKREREIPQGRFMDVRGGGGRWWRQMIRCGDPCREQLKGEVLYNKCNIYLKENTLKIWWFGDRKRQEQKQSESEKIFYGSSFDRLLSKRIVDQVKKENAPKAVFRYMLLNLP